MINFGVSEQKKVELEQRMQKCKLLEKDIEETFVRSRGSGKQKVNKTSSCVQLKHIPTGLAVKVQKSRSQVDLDGSGGILRALGRVVCDRMGHHRRVFRALETGCPISVYYCCHILSAQVSYRQ